MTIRKVGYLQGTVPAPYKLPAEDHRLLRAGQWLPSSALGGLRVRSGLLPGPGSPGLVAVTTGGVNVNPFHAVIQGTLTSTQGEYEMVSDAVEFRAITAASGTEFRRGYVIARIYDQLNPGTGTVQDLPTVEVVYGPNAASAGAATLPALPANSLVLREFAVSNTGVITLVSTSAPPWTTARGGIQVVDVADTVAGAYADQYRSHPTRGLERWNGTRWVRAGDVPVFATLAARNAFYDASNPPVSGTQCLCLGVVMTHDGVTWRFMTMLGGGGVGDAAGYVVTAHGFGQTPVYWQPVATTGATDQLTIITKAVPWSADANNYTIRHARTDTSSFLGGNGINWTAVFRF
jgi:hypothetical protein